MAKLLQQIRSEARLSQLDLCRKAGFYATLVAKTELGQRRLDAIELVRWCEACGRDPAEVIRLI